MKNKEFEIVTHPDKRLRKKSLVVSKEELAKKETQALILAMADVMIEKDGVGLAAPQIGIQKRIVIIFTKDGPLSLINPKIIKNSWRKETDEEGCLSVPNTYGNVKRSYKITVTALSLKGKKVEFIAQGLFARIIMHEVDHLDGVLFIDKAKKLRHLSAEVL